MAYNLGASIKLDGEKEFKKAVSEINAGLRVTTSQLKLVTEKYSENATSVKALTERGQALENQISGQREKIERLRAALANSANIYGEADRKTMNWQVSLNKAETELLKMEGELKNNSDALEKATDDMEKYGIAEDEVAEKSRGFGDVISDLAGALGIQLPAGADKAIRALDGQKVSTMALLGATAALVTSFAKTTIETAKMADEIITLSDVTGVSTDTLQGWRYASDQLDVSVETMTGSMTRMIKSMGNAQNGSKEANEAFRRLRVSFRDMTTGELKDSETMFYQLIDALGNVKNETERDALAMQIFGRSARELNPLIKAGSKSLAEFVEEAKKMGYVIDDEALDNFNELDKSMHKFEAQTRALKNSIAMVMLPALTAFFEMLNKIDPKVLATIAIIGSMAVVAVTVVKAIKNVTDMFGGLNPVAMKTTGIIVVVTASLIALAAIIAVIIGKGEQLDRTIAGIGTSVGDMTNVVNNAGNRVGRNALGTNNWRGGLTWINEEGPELIDLPSGTKIYDRKTSVQMARNGQLGETGGDIINVYVNAKDLDEMAKVVRVFNNLKQTKRAGVIYGNA